MFDTSQVTLRCRLNGSSFVVPVCWRLNEFPRVAENVNERFVVENLFVCNEPRSINLIRSNLS